MYLPRFPYTATTITYEDGLVAELCSLHCAALHMQLTPEKKYKKIEVGDFNTGEKINAEEAFWVIDVIKPGLMTTQAKRAFHDKAEAKAYLDENRGRFLSFKEALEGALKW